MKTIIKTLRLAIAFVLLSNTALAQEVKQDSIVRVDKNVIECVVTEFNTTEVKYYYPDRPGIVLALESELVDYVRLNTGEIMRPENNDDLITNLAYESQRKMALKVGFLTPLQGYTDLGFEYSLKPLQSIEAKIGIIGLGNNETFLDEGKSSGLSFSAGYKFYATPEFHLRKVRSAHRMRGLYMMPTLALSYHLETDKATVSDPVTFQTKKVDVTSSVFKAALMVNFGKQVVFADRFTLDANVGVGYGVKEVTKKDWPFEDIPTWELFSYDRPHGLTIFDGSGFALSSSLKLGVLINK